MKLNTKKQCLKEICQWIKDYEEVDEHSCGFSIELKDDAYEIFNNLLKFFK